VDECKPLVPGCECFTCANHSRGYIHHLLQCHEMTAVGEINNARLVFHLISTLHDKVRETT